VIGEFGIHLADQIPQANFLPGQTVPSFTNQDTLSQIMADFEETFGKLETDSNDNATFGTPTSTDESESVTSSPEAVHQQISESQTFKVHSLSDNIPENLIAHGVLSPESMQTHISQTQSMGNDSAETPMPHVIPSSKPLAKPKPPPLNGFNLATSPNAVPVSTLQAQPPTLNSLGGFMSRGTQSRSESMYITTEQKPVLYNQIPQTPYQPSLQSTTYHQKTVQHQYQHQHQHQPGYQAQYPYAQLSPPPSATSYTYHASPQHIYHPSNFTLNHPTANYYYPPHYPDADADANNAIGSNLV
jgi:hypothetical protein